MQTFIRKITSRKFLAALAGVATGLAMVFGVDETAISTVAGAVTTVASVVSYIMSEGMVDAAAVGAANADAGKFIRKAVAKGLYIFLPQRLLFFLFLVRQLPLFRCPGQLVDPVDFCLFHAIVPF